MKITNDTEEEITLEPGETVDVYADEETNKVMSKRAKTVRINDVK